MKKRFTIKASADLTDDQAQMLYQLSEFAADVIREIEADYGKKLSQNGWGQVMDVAEEFAQTDISLSNAKLTLEAYICDIYEDDTGITGIYESTDIRGGTMNKRKFVIKASKADDKFYTTKFPTVKPGEVKVAPQRGNYTVFIGLSDGTIAYQWCESKVAAEREAKYARGEIKRYGPDDSYWTEQGYKVWNPKAEASTSTKRKFTVEAAQHINKEMLSDLIDYAEKHNMTSRWKAEIVIPYMERLQKMYAVSDDDFKSAVKKAGDTVKRKGKLKTNPYDKFDISSANNVSSSTSTKRKFVVKAACGKKSVKSASRPVTQEYITEEFVKKANDDYLTTAYENNNLTVILIEGSDLVILADGPNHGEIEKRAKEIAGKIYPQYGVIGDYKDLSEKGYSDAPVSAVKCSTRDEREELSGTYYITYNGKIIVETDGTGDIGAEALREVFAMDADALDAAAKYLNSFGDELVYNRREERDDGSVEYWIDDEGEWDVDDVSATLAQFIQMEYDEGQMDPTYFGSEIYWDGGRIEWFDAADLADDVNSSTDITAARRDDTIDKEAVRELVLYITNDGDLYRQRVTPMIENLKRKVKKGTYDREKAVKLWQYLADDGVKKYGKEFGPGASVAWLNPATREEIARKLRDYYEEEVMWDQNHPVEASTYMIVPDSGTVPFDSDIIDILAYYGYSTLEDFALANGIRDFVKAKQILLERYAEDTESGYPSSLWDGKSENEIYADLPEAGFIDDDIPYL